MSELARRGHYVVCRCMLPDAILVWTNVRTRRRWRRQTLKSVLEHRQFYYQFVHVASYVIVKLGTAWQPPYWIETGYRLTATTSRYGARWRRQPYIGHCVQRLYNKLILCDIRVERETFRAARKGRQLDGRNSVERSSILDHHMQLQLAYTYEYLYPSSKQTHRPAITKARHRAWLRWSYNLKWYFPRSSGQC